jgi:hypothetical protein
MEVPGGSREQKERRKTFHRIAKATPGTLTVRGLAQFKIFMSGSLGDRDEDELAPVVLKYLERIRAKLPNQGDRRRDV